MNTPNAYAPPKANVADVTPDAEMVLAGRLRRLGAAILDGIIFGVLVYSPLAFAGGFTDALREMAQSGNVFSIFGLFASAAGVVSLLLLVAWSVITYRLVAANGQTIAKKWLGIKVVRSDGSRATVARIFWLRNVVNTIISVIPLIGSFYGLIDALFIFGERRQCVHDKIADTIVINA